MAHNSQRLLNTYLKERKALENSMRLLTNLEGRLKTLDNSNKWNGHVNNRNNNHSYGDQTSHLNVDTTMNDSSRVPSAQPHLSGPC